MTRFQVILSVVVPVVLLPLAAVQYISLYLSSNFNKNLNKNLFPRSQIDTVNSHSLYLWGSRSWLVWQQVFFVCMYIHVCFYLYPEIRWSYSSITLYLGSRHISFMFSPSWVCCCCYLRCTGHSVMWHHIVL